MVASATPGMGSSASLRLGAELRRLRKALHLDRSELSHRVGISPSDLARIERDELRVSLDTLARLTEVLGVDSSGDLFPGASGPADPGARRS